MMSIYNKKYYTMDLIPQHRHEYINLRLQWFIDLFDLKATDWPLDCTLLIKKMKELQLIPFEYGFFELPPIYDALTEYNYKYNVYLMQINKNKAKYPYEHSHERRLNFTLAHEVAHIILDHLKIPREAKTSEEKILEELEADELGGILLMPKHLILSCNYPSLKSTSEFFIVSETALWKRLNNMKRLDLLTSRKISTCITCGNTCFSIFSEFCGICGNPVRNSLNGFKRVYYTQQIKLDKYRRVLECPLCKSDVKYAKDDRCTICGTHIFNYCSSYFKNIDDCPSNPSNNRFCEICGNPTYFFEKGFLDPWQEELREKFPLRS
ncbi:ImmA/IrrE family metallo-endopeptidase [Clostridium sp. CS001]|uniref:ImmA/IrrE family metallo-endopeptidase n=1 Tax=Clostridium sp. CS001 TaxID=2880648 RepID=UPI001CF216BC|nr:ImmA/IrrE family metallo-endopeptidase [Clostridium sp. CS001]MCB2291434.1 ImmA/IrrE family metallo-endopeptidase [Clostridium sp. CS001]